MFTFREKPRENIFPDSAHWYFRSSTFQERENYMPSDGFIELPVHH
jgi:hypothetical protein